MKYRRYAYTHAIYKLYALKQSYTYVEINIILALTKRKIYNYANTKRKRI